MEIYPGIDIRDGKVVRLTQGDYGRMTVYLDNPAEAAERFAKDGARNLHLVDLDGARDGSASNEEAIRAVAERSRLFLQIGGGIRDETRVRKYLDMGMGRVILGTAALEDSGFLRRMLDMYGDKIAVSVDARDGMVAVRGWRETTAEDSLDFCGKLRDAGVSVVIYTDISKDGMGGGTNLDIYRKLVRETGLNIIASGGISYPNEIIELKNAGAYGAIVGKALYDGRLKLREVLEKC